MIEFTFFILPQTYIFTVRVFLIKVKKGRHGTYNKNKYNTAVRSVSLLRWYINVMIDYFDVIHCPTFIENHISDTGFSPPSIKRPALVALIHRANPCLQTPEPRQDKIYIPNTTELLQMVFVVFGLHTLSWLFLVFSDRDLLY